MEEEKSLARKWGIRNTPEWSPESLYWNRDSKEWVTLDNATTFDKIPMDSDVPPMSTITTIWE